MVSLQLNHALVCAYIGNAQCWVVGEMMDVEQCMFSALFQLCNVSS
jgi:hypothetical protein